MEHKILVQREALRDHTQHSTTGFDYGLCFLCLREISSRNLH
jgi:hypothetical protein